MIFESSNGSISLRLREKHANFQTDTLCGMKEAQVSVSQRHIPEK